MRQFKSIETIVSYQIDVRYRFIFCYSETLRQNTIMTPIMKECWEVEYGVT
jgi:hypothetical protein